MENKINELITTNENFKYMTINEYLSHFKFDKNYITHKKIRLLHQKLMTEIKLQKINFDYLFLKNERLRVKSHCIKHYKKIDESLLSKDLDDLLYHTQYYLIYNNYFDELTKLINHINKST